MVWRLPGLLRHPPQSGSATAYWWDERRPISFFFLASRLDRLAAVGWYLQTPRAADLVLTSSGGLAEPIWLGLTCSLYLPTGEGMARRWTSRCCWVSPWRWRWGPTSWMSCRAGYWHLPWCLPWAAPACSSARLVLGCSSSGSLPGWAGNLSWDCATQLALSVSLGRWAGVFFIFLL